MFRPQTLCPVGWNYPTRLAKPELTSGDPLFSASRHSQTATVSHKWTIREATEDPLLNLNAFIMLARGKAMIFNLPALIQGAARNCVKRCSAKQRRWPLSARKMPRKPHVGHLTPWVRIMQSAPAMPSIERTTQTKRSFQRIS